MSTDAGAGMHGEHFKMSDDLLSRYREQFSCCIECGEVFREILCHSRCYGLSQPCWR